MVPMQLVLKLCGALWKQFRFPSQPAPNTMPRKRLPHDTAPPAGQTTGREIPTWKLRTKMLPTQEIGCRHSLNRKTNRCSRIVPDGSIFVNSNAGRQVRTMIVALVVANLLCGLNASQNQLWAQNSPSPSPPGNSIQESPVFVEAKEKLGAPSRFVWAEGGSSSLDRWQARSLLELDGVIVSWETDQLLLVKPNGVGTTTLPGDLLVGITPGWKSPSFERTHQLWLNKEFAKVISSGQSALAEREIPKWQQRLLVTEMIESAMALNQTTVAARIFQALGNEPIPELLLSRIPLPWSTELDHVPPAVATEASVWMNKESPSLKLLGAAWSLTGPNRLEAVEVLKDLAKLKEQSKPTYRLIASYAQVQLWRTIPEDTILSKELDNWYQLRDSLQIPLQAGPTALLATRLEQANQPELALAEWLRILTLHSDRAAIANLAQTHSKALAKKLQPPNSP